MATNRSKQYHAKYLLSIVSSRRGNAQRIMKTPVAQASRVFTRIWPKIFSAPILSGTPAMCLVKIVDSCFSSLSRAVSVVSSSGDQGHFTEWRLDNRRFDRHHHRRQFLRRTPGKARWPHSTVGSALTLHPEALSSILGVSTYNLLSEKIDLVLLRIVYSAA